MLKFTGDSCRKLLLFRHHYTKFSGSTFKGFHPIAWTPELNKAFKE
jgi:hypothetical protein